MSDQTPSSSLSGDADTGTVHTTTTPRWAPHGRALTACIVAVNIALIFLVYLYFWRVLSRKRVASSSGAPAPGGDDSDDASSSASAPSSPPRIQDRGEHDSLVASLPTFVHSGSAVGEKAVECAVCIAELRDGDEGRALPRCGHRFHAACVDAWLRLHTTCPLCRASVVVPAPEAEPKGGVPNTTAAVEDIDAPV